MVPLWYHIKIYLFNMTVNFILRGSLEPKSICVRFRHGKSIDIRISTGLNIESKYWDKRI